MVLDFLLDIIQQISWCVPRLGRQRPISSIKEQFLDNLLISFKVIWLRTDPHNRDVKGSLTTDILSIYISSKLDEQLHIHELLLQDCKV